jgi:hypothetical protein
LVAQSTLIWSRPIYRTENLRNTFTEISLQKTFYRISEKALFLISKGKKGRGFAPCQGQGHGSRASPAAAAAVVIPLPFQTPHVAREAGVQGTPAGYEENDGRKPTGKPAQTFLRAGVYP